MKRVLSVQDISCIGRCSQTVALPVISAAGCRCDILPTAVLSTHTAFPGPHKRSLTQDIAPIVAHWKTIGAEFDAILVGYLADSAQVCAVESLLDSFSAMRIIDPAMGDNGKLYSGIVPAHIDALQQLCAKADIVLPNISEAACLTGLPYREAADSVYFEELLDGLMALGAKAAILTGAAPAGQAGFYGRVNNKTFSHTAALQPGCHGTGDLFAAAFTGALMAYNDIPRAAVLAARFVEKALSLTQEKTPFGVEFEKALPWLCQQTQS